MFRVAYKNDSEQDFKNSEYYYAESVSSNVSLTVSKMDCKGGELTRRESLIIYEEPTTRARAVSDTCRYMDEQTKWVFDENVLSRLNVYKPQHERATSETGFQFKQSPKFRLWRTNSGTPMIKSKAGMRLGMEPYIDDESSSSMHCHDLSLTFSNTGYTEHRLDCQSPFACKTVHGVKEDDEIRRRSRRGTELEPCYHIQIVKGPRPGLYELSARVDGRPSWESNTSSLQWSVGLRSWLLRDIGSRKFMCLAMLNVDVINPCISKQLWRVTTNSRHAFYHNWAFKADTQMNCVGLDPSAFLQAKEASFQENTLVMVKRGLGIARFIGPLEGQKGTFVGVELFAPKGLNNGTHKGLFYFEARRNHAVFVRYPQGVIDFFGHISDKAAILVEELLVMVATVPSVTEKAKERSIKVLVKISDSKNLFCASKKTILKLILFYELVMRKY